VSSATCAISYARALPAKATATQATATLAERQVRRQQLTEFATISEDHLDPMLNWLVEERHRATHLSVDPGKRATKV
jgi:hypothetical protein